MKMWAVSAPQPGVAWCRQATEEAGTPELSQKMVDFFILRLLLMNVYGKMNANGR